MRIFEDEMQIMKEKVRQIMLIIVASLFFRMVDYYVKVNKTYMILYPDGKPNILNDLVVLVCTRWLW